MIRFFFCSEKDILFPGLLGADASFIDLKLEM